MKYDLTITPTPEKAEVSVTVREDCGADIYDITITSDEPVTGVKITFHIPAGDIAGRWFPRMKMFDKGVHNSWEGATWTNFTGGAPSDGGSVRLQGFMGAQNRRRRPDKMPRVHRRDEESINIV